jgi:RNA polymerase sigma-70 factor (ECF subfamily)
VTESQRTPKPVRDPDITPEEVFRRYRDTVYRLAVARTGSHHNADEILQEVFLRYIRSAPLFLDEEHRKAWLLRVTVNCCNSFMGSAWRRHTVPLEENLGARPKEQSDLWETLRSLSPTHRTVIHLFYYEDYSISEIAQILKITESNVKVRLSRGRSLLRDNMQEDLVYD